MKGTGVLQAPPCPAASQQHSTSTWACCATFSLSLLAWEVGLKLALASLVLLADTELIYLKCRVSCAQLFLTFPLWASCPELTHSC